MSINKQERIKHAMSERVLLVGNGGREHALAWKLQQSSLVQHIYVAPGNGGTASIGTNVENVNLSQDNFAELLKFAVDNKITLVVPGPEAPLVEGITDYFRQHGPASISVFGPSKVAAQMEGSKAFSKDFMKRHNIPTAAYETFTEHDAAQKYLDQNKDIKVVIKASGLAAGKGVIIPTSHQEASDALKAIMLDKEFGTAGDSVVIEEFLEGEELSILSFSDGASICSLPAAQDHKRINDNDQGPNTGGMGAYAPIPIATPALMDTIHRTVLQPTIDGMAAERMPFRGVLFTGFMVDPTGKPKVLEYNVRFGDPETQTLLPLLQTDLAELMLACCNNYLRAITLDIAPSFSATVVAAAGGYPGSYAKGTPMTLQSPAAETYIFHAGTSLSQSNQLATSGGRVIAATATASDLKTAVAKAYTGMSTIHFDKMHYRKDIAHRALSRPAVTLTQAETNNHTAMTYASAGVSIDAGNSLVQRIKASVKSTARPGAGALIGGFGGEISLPLAGYGTTAPRLVTAIDGIGTKLLIAQALNDPSTVGIDLVAMNVNDLIVQGAEPLGFLDYYACSALDVDFCARFVESVAEGCRRANCALVGGETAEMPGIYAPGDFDAGGCAIGALKHGRTMLPDVDGMRAGDVLVGLGSDGCHSNGFSLVRKIVERAGLKYESACPWKEGESVGRALLTPTRVYVRSLLGVLDKCEGAIKGMAHITGGGLTDNIPRMLPKGLAAKVNVGSWDALPVFEWLRREGRMEAREFARTFNTGLGMVMAVDAGRAEEVVEALKSAGEKVYMIGELVERSQAEGKTGYEEGCWLDGLGKWDL